MQRHRRRLRWRHRQRPDLHELLHRRRRRRIWRHLGESRERLRGGLGQGHEQHRLQRRQLGDQAQRDRCVRRRGQQLRRHARSIELRLDQSSRQRQDRLRRRHRRLDAERRDRRQRLGVHADQGRRRLQRRARALLRHDHGRLHDHQQLYRHERLPPQGGLGLQRFGARDGQLPERLCGRLRDCALAEQQCAVRRPLDAGEQRPAHVHRFGEPEPGHQHDKRVVHLPHRAFAARHRLGRHLQDGRNLLERHHLLSLERGLRRRAAFEQCRSERRDFHQLHLARRALHRCRQRRLLRRC